jgi:putative membrane protein
VIIFSNGIEYLIINYEKSFLLTLGWLMLLSSLYVVNFFKPLLKDFFLLVFFLIGALSGIFFQEMVFVAGEITGLYLFLSGILAFSFFLIPGISGSAVLVILGVYPVVIQGIANFNLQTLIPFGIGCLISLIILPKFILNLFLIYEQRLMFIFSGLIFASGYLLI